MRQQRRQRPRGVRRRRALVGAVGLSIVTALASWLTYSYFVGRVPTSVATTPTVAILPFASSDSPGIDALANGLSADLQTRLEYLDEIQCVPRALVRRLADTELPAEELGRRLGAEILVSGQTSGAAGRVSLTLTLQPTSGHRTTITLQLGESAESILDLQPRVARQVAEALEVSPSFREQRWLTADATRSVKAWHYASQGRSYLESSSTDRAAQFAADLYRSALQLDPAFSEARAGLAEALWRQQQTIEVPDRYELAEEQARQALALTPHRSSAAVTLVKIRLWRDPTDRPVRNRWTELRRSPKPDEARRQLAVELWQSGELEMAETVWRSAVAVNDSHWVNWYGLGGFLEHSGRFAEAMEAYREAYSRSPVTVPWALQNILRLQLATDRSADALDTFGTLGLERVSELDSLANVAMLLGREGRWVESEAVLRKALRVAPDNPQVALELGRTLIRMARSDATAEVFEHALEAAERQLDASPEDLDRRLQVAEAAAYSGDCQRALLLAAQSRRRPSIDRERSRSLARIFALCDRPKPALERLREALRLGLPWDAVIDDPTLTPLLDADTLRELQVSVDVRPRASRSPG